jgi:type II secretory pathway pseudopilin PulG
MTKSEIIGIFIIFIILISISLPNFASSIKKSRDQARKDDLGSVYGALSEYYHDFGKYPLGSPDGKIVGCKNPEDKTKVDKHGALSVNLIPCQWGKDGLVDLTPGSTKVYISPLPIDLDYTKIGTSYFYFSDGERYQIYGSLESHDWDEYDPKIIARNIMCGKKICNFGRSSPNTPTDISLEEYRTILNAQQ